MKNTHTESRWSTVHVHQPLVRPCDEPITIEPAALADVQHLLTHHYRQQPLTCCCCVLAAKVDGLLAGCLIVTHASLNGAYRTRAWPTWPTDLSKKDHALFVNRMLRRIARVVVLPAVRGQGLATALVRAYLAQPLTPLTESIAAMGTHAPIFVAAGMRAIDSPPSASQRAMQRILQEHGIVPWRLMDDDLLHEAAQRAGLVEACRRWARASRITKGLIDAPASELLRACAWRASASRGVYVHGGGTGLECNEECKEECK